MRNTNVFERMASLSDEKRALLKARLMKSKTAKNPSIPRRQKESAGAPLSFAQERLWFLAQLEPDSSFYNESGAISFDGNIDVYALVWSINEIIKRHEILRTTFVVCDGQPKQFVTLEPQVAIKYVDLQQWSAQKHMLEAHRLMEEEARQPFNLAVGPLFRTVLIQLAPHKHILQLLMHHIIADEWSISLFAQELSMHYGAYFGNKISPLSELPIQYADYACWQRDWLQGDRFDKQIAYWVQQLEGATSVLNLPIDFPRSPEPQHSGKKYYFDIPQELSAPLSQLNKAHGVTSFMTIATVFSVLLHRYSGQSDICIGYPVASRTRAELHPMIGFFANTLVLRADMSDDPSFASLLARIKDTMFDNQARQDLPFGALVDTLQPTRDAAVSPLFQVMLVYQNTTDEKLKLPGIKTTSILDVETGGAKFDVTLCIKEVAGQLQAWLEYKTQLFHERTMARWAEHYKQLLKEVLARPQTPISELFFLPEAEQNQLLVEWNQTTADIPKTQCIQQLFEAQVMQTPNATAVIFENEQLTYEALNSKANQLAHYLQHQGVGPEVPVGICIERSLEMVIGILGILKAGGAYVPIDPSYPNERIAFMVEDIQPLIILTQETLRAQLPLQSKQFCLDTQWHMIAEESINLPTLATSPENLAYVIYTSGSTGKPKGVEITHYNLLNSTLGRLGYYKAQVNGFLLLSSIAFDSSVAGLFGTLCQGGRLILPHTDTVLDSNHLSNLIALHKVSHILATPSLYEAVLKQIASDTDGNLIVAIVAGETCHKNLVDLQHQHLPQTELFNEYGPTEATVWSTVHQCSAQYEGRIPIGRPIANTQIYLLDNYLNPVPLGVAGEIYIGGLGLARGYRNQSTLTAERFVPNPFSSQSGERLYRTGDQARYQIDGKIEYLGRIDHQVKIRGFRIELGEIDAVLVQYPQIKEAVVMLREDNSEHKQLVAYVVEHESTQDIEGIRMHLKKSLPEFMIPTNFIFLDNLPLTSNGKIDRKSLPAPNATVQPEHQYVAPRNPTEECLVNIWAEILKVKRVGIYDNFFELGGDSILSIQVVSRSRQSGISITPKDLFQHQTVASLAAKSGHRLEISSEQGLIEGEVLLTPIQHWFFEQTLPNPHHWNQSVILEANESFEVAAFEKVIKQLELHHDALRLRFVQKNGQWQQHCRAESSIGVFQKINLTKVSNDNWTQVIETEAVKWQKELNISKGPLWRVVWFNLGKKQRGRLLIVIHHLAVDGISWRILLEDIQRGYEQTIKGLPIDLPAKTTSFKQWSSNVQAHIAGGMLDSEANYWLQMANAAYKPLPVDNAAGSNIVALTGEIKLSLNKIQTNALLTHVPPAYNTQINDILLTALTQTLCNWSQEDSVLIELEGHGREDLFKDIDLSRTVGWFTSIFPIIITRPQSDNFGNAIKSIKEQLRKIPNKGIGYGLLRYFGNDEISECLQRLASPQISFNYLGQFDQNFTDGSLFTIGKESTGLAHHELGIRSHEIDINSHVLNGQLHICWSYSTERYQKETINNLAQTYVETIESIIQHCVSLQTREYTPSDFPLAQFSQQELDTILDKRKDIEDIYPLAPLQQGLMFHSLYAPDSGIYCNQFSCMLSGDLNINLFAQAWQQLVAKHPIMRTAFLYGESEDPLQLVYSKVDLPIVFLDWQEIPIADQTLNWKEYLTLDRHQGFDFNKAPLMRLAFIQSTQDRYYFLWSHHHTVLDGWCTPLIFNEVFNIYKALKQGQEAITEHNRPYRDYIAWLQQQDNDKAEAYWRSTLSGFSTFSSLGINDGVLNEADHIKVAMHNVTISPGNSSRLVDFAKRHQLTLNTLVQTTWALLLSHYSGEQDVIFGITVSGRPAELDGIDRMIGLFINTVPLRVQVQPEVPIKDWLHTLLQQNLELRHYEYAPLVEIKEWSDIPHGQPFFESLLIFENYPVDWTIENQAKNLGVHDIAFTEQTNYPLTITVAQIPEKGLTLRFDYQKNLFDEEKIIRIAQHFQRLLDEIVSMPDQYLSELSILTDSERRQLLLDWNNTETEYSQDSCIHQLFEAQVRRSPNAVAIIFEKQRLTYAALNAQANQLAHYLSSQGIGPEVLVGICAERSLEMIIGILGILKAGGAYMPIDPNYPLERIAFMMKDAQPAMVLIHAATREIFPDSLRIIDMEAEQEAIAQWSTLNPVLPDLAKNLAYVIYTSGSTGKPKGSGLAHQGVVNSLEWMQQQYQLDSHDRVLQKTPYSFDVSVLELFCPLLNGARLIITPPDTHKDGEYIVEMIKRYHITVVHFVPSMLSAFLNISDVQTCQTLQDVICIGEALPETTQRKFFDKLPAVQLSNLYGPVEASIIATKWSCKQDSIDKIVPIGRPIANTQIYLLDAYLNPVAIGVIGELYIGGVGLARCYQNRTTLTAEQFIPNPFNFQPGERLYRTGDLARYRADGNIEFLGRTDHQVKIRGFRIELGEIEAALLQHMQIKEAAVIVRQDSSEDKRLVAYVVVSNDSTPSVEDLQLLLKTHLPDYMIPGLFVFLDSLPLNSNGKIDRNALPTPSMGDQLSHQYVAPRNTTEEVLTNIWSEILGVEQVGIQDNFFKLGGHSLLVMQVVSRIHTEFQVKISLRTVFEETTIETLARMVEAAQWLNESNAQETLQNNGEYEEIEL